MYIGVHPRGDLRRGVHPRRTSTATRCRRSGDSGQRHPWGLGTDTFEVNQYRPFMTLYSAVTGKMVGGNVVNHQPINREDALIAHTRKNAISFFPAREQHRIDSTRRWRIWS